MLAVGLFFCTVGVFGLRDRRCSENIASRAPLAERSAVNRQVLGSIPSGGVFFLFFQSFLFFRVGARSDPLRNFNFARLKYCQQDPRKPCSAEVSSDRTNLSPFTKDYRGLALQCD